MNAWAARSGARLLGGVCLVLLSCAHAPPRQAPELRVEERLEELGPATFRLSARLSRPVASLPFTRPGDGDRLRTFRLVEPKGARLEADGEVERIVGAAPFDRVVLEVPVHEHNPEKDYAPFFPLQGRGVFVYTGQLDLGEQHASQATYEFVPAAGHSVVIPGTAAVGSLRWEASGDGTYVAFGDLRQSEDAGFIAVIDPGFPLWLRDEARRFVPALFRHYAGALRQPLPTKPTVFLSYGAAAGPGAISLKGGVVGGVLQVDVRLGARRAAAQDADVLDVLRHSLAHEAAHLWNSHFVTPTGADWVHEGGADLLAWSAQRALGVLPGRDYLEGLSWATSVCASLRGPGELGKDPVKARYACGAVVELIVSAQPGIEAVWARLLSSARESGRYDEASFFAAALSAGASERARADAAALAGAGSADRIAPVKAALEAAGYEVVEGQRPPARFARFAAELGSRPARWLSVRGGPPRR